MKIRLFSLVLAVVLMTSVLSGCSLWQTAARLDAAEDAVEARVERVEDAVDAAIEPQLPAPSQPTAALTQTDAENAALAHAGFAAGQVTGLRSEYEVDDGVPHYDVRFRVDLWEYEYEIHAKTGAVLSFEKDD